MANSSRLQRRVQKSNKKTIIFYIIALCIILYVLFNFGLWLLTNISGYFISLNEKGEQNETRQDIDAFLIPPDIDSVPLGTSSAILAVIGESFDEEGEVEVYLNNSLQKTVELKGETEFEARLTGLKEGENTIKARYVSKDGKKSDFSKEKKVTYSKDPPKLEISFPSENAEFRKGDEQINIQGTTNPDVKVTVNDFTAIVDDDGKFTYYLRLIEGDNIIKVKAQNNAGLTTEKQVKVIYLP